MTVLVRKIVSLTLATLVLFFFVNCGSDFSSNPGGTSSSSSSGSDESNNSSGPVTPTPTTPTAGTPAPVTPTPGTPASPTPTTPVMVDVFMASGHMGRTVFSCDDGRTWIHDKSENDNARCWVDGNPNYVECDHTPFSGRGLEYGDGWFFANFGWGYNGSLRRSRDGVNWQTMRSDGSGFGVAYVGGVLMVTWGGGGLSLNQGMTWQRYAVSPIDGALDHPQLLRVGNKFALLGRDTGAVRFSLSLDQGVNWIRPASLQVDWLKDIEEGNGRMVVVGYSNSVSYSAISTDNGLTWTARTQTAMNGARLEYLVFTGTQFVSWGAGKRWTSADGLTWIAANMNVENLNPDWMEGQVAYNPTTGTYVRIHDSWNGYYGMQKAYRSSDGITWQMVPPTAFKGGHPIRNMVLGKMEPRFCL